MGVRAEDLMKKYMRYLGPMLITAIFFLALYLLYNKLKQYSIAQIEESMGQVSSWRILVSLLSTAASYVILIGYDWLAIRAIHKRLALPRVCLVSFVGQAVSYNFGALLGGTTVRYRFYSAWDFSVSDIVRLVLMLAVTFWVGVLGMCGVFFVVAPPHIPDELVAHMPFADLRLLGAVLFIVAMVYMLLCFRVRHPVHILGKEFVFPAPHLALAQFVVACVDIFAAAFCMYILLPGSLGITFLEFVPSYLLAQVAVVLTHVPGGVGIFELIIINLTHTDQTQVVFAAVLLFRLIYFILPLLLAALVFAAYEVRTRRSLWHDACRWLRVLSHSITAYMTFALGVCYLVSSIWPLSQELLRGPAALPAPITALSQYLLAAAGATLLFVSYGLEHREACARKATQLVILMGMVAALGHGFSWITALFGLALFALVQLSKHRFYRTASFYRDGLPLYWLTAALGTLLVLFFSAWALYHLAWSWQTLVGANAQLNACRSLRAFLLIFVCLIALWGRRQLTRKKEKTGLS